MDARTIIAGLRDGHGLPAEAARWFADGLADGGVTDAQAGAFAMAVFLRGLSDADRVCWTAAMRDSGEVLRWDLPGPVLDKHSTGGIGDSTSILLAPALAACGAYVPMISGRGLGHTGGTLDKLEAIPGYGCDVSTEALQRLVADLGCAIVGANADISPADRRLYGIRDVTGTVESIDLITASILSKKLSAGLQALVLDVKVGSGAFMKTPERAAALARSLVDTANGAGCRTSALITDMDEPLAHSAGNAVEMRETMDVLTGRGRSDALYEVTLALGGEGLALAGLADSAEDGRRRIGEAVSSGRAAEIFDRMVAALGGPTGFSERYDALLPRAPVVLAVTASAEGYVAAIDGAALGNAVVRLGGGRLRGDDVVDPSVGLAALAPVGVKVAAGTVLAEVHAADAAAAEAAAQDVRNAYRLASAPPPARRLVQERIA